MLLLLNALLFWLFIIINFTKYLNRNKKYIHLASVYVVQCLFLASWKAIDSKNKLLSD